MIGDVHGVSDRAASSCIHTVAQSICDNMEQFLTWPDADEVRRAKFDFYTKENWPSIVGLVDGTHVPLHTPFPPAIEAAYVNRKGFHSMNCQIVCDSSLKIFNIDPRFPGANHDAFVLRHSHVWDRFERGDMPNTWLLGDSGYPLKRWLITPFVRPANAQQERFNRRHKQIRSAVERCNGVLKMRWRCLTKPIMFQPTKATKIIASCGALHNFCLQHRFAAPDGAEDFNDGNMLVNDFIYDGPRGRAEQEGNLMRLNIVNRLFARN